MPRKKKQTFEEIQCPVRGHSHKIKVVPDENAPDFLVAYCGDRMVYRTFGGKKRPDPPAVVYDYKVPKF